MAIRDSGVRYDIIARDSASRTFRTVGASASQLERGLGKLAKAAGVAGLALTAGVAVGLFEGTKKAVAFEASMKKIQTQAGASAKDVGVLSKQVLDLGKTTQQGPEKLSEALYHLKSVGMDNVDAMKALKTASDLAAVGGADLESTTNALAGAWRTGIRGATNFGQAAATVNAIIGAGNMSMEDLTAALGTGILPTAKTFGLTFSQVGAALALFTDEGVDSASAATRLRMSISLLAAPSRAAEKQLKTIGLTGNMLGQAMRSKDGIIGAIKLLSLHLQKSGLDATHQAALLSRAFGGGKSSSAILSMVNNLDVLEKKQLQVNGSMGKYGPAVIAQRKTAAAQFALIRSNFEVFSIKAGNLLLPPITAFTTYINKTGLPAIHRYTQDLAGIVPVDKIKAGFATATGLVGDFIDGIMPKSKKKTLTAPAIQIKAPTVPGMLRKPFVFTTPAPQIKSAKASIPKMLQVPKAQDSEAKKFGLQLRGLISGGIGDALKGIDWGGLGKTIGSGLATAVGWVGEHVSDLTKKFIKILGKIDYVQIGKSFGKMAIPLSIGIITSLFDPLFSLSFWEHHWLDTLLAVLSFIPMGKIAGPLAKAFEHIPVLRIFSPLLRGIEKVGKPIGDAAAGVAKFFGKSLWEGIARVFPAGAGVLERETGLLTTRLGVWGLDLMRAGERALRGLGNGIKTGTGWVIAKIGEGIGHLLKPFADSGVWLVKKGAALVDGLLSGARGAMAGVGGWLRAHLVDPIVSWVKGLFGIHSPSTVFAGIGGNLVRGLISGVAAAAKGIGGWLYGRLVAPVLGAFSGAAGWLVGRGQQVVSGLESGLWSLAKGMGGWVTTNVVNKVTGAFSGASTWLYDKGTSLMSGLLQGIKDGFKDVSGYLGSTVKNGLKSVGGLVGKIPGFAAGGVAPIGTVAWVGERGPELMKVTSAGTRVYSNPDSMALARHTRLQIPGYASGTVSLSHAKADVSAAQHKVDQLEKQIAALRRAEAKAHTARQRKRDQLAIMAEEERLKAARTTLTAAKKTLTAAQAQAKRVQSVADTIANGFLRTLETGTASAIASAVKGMNSKLQTAGAGSLVGGNLRTSTRLQALANQKAGVASRIAAANQYASDQSAGLGDFLSLSNIPASSLGSLISRMQSSQGTASKFAAEVTDLRKRGLSTDILGQLADAGPGSQLAALLSKATAGDIGQLNKLAASQKKLTVSFGQTMADAMYDSGKNAGKGFLTGLQQQEKDLQAEMDKLAAGMVATIKKKLGIKSPSTVMRDQVGRQVALGAAAGVRLHAPRATAEVQRMADTMAAVRARTTGGRVAEAVTGGAPQVVHHHHETKYEINARTADFTMQHLETVQRRVEARERVGRPR